MTSSSCTPEPDSRGLGPAIHAFEHPKQRIGIGSSLAAPPSPTTVHADHVHGGSLDYAGPDHKGRQAEGGEESVGQGKMPGGGKSHPPGTMTATGGASRQVVVHAATAQLFVPLASTLPLLPSDGAQPSPDPLVQTAQLRRQFTEPKYPRHPIR